MAKRSKGFGDLLKQEKRKAKNLTKPLPKFTALRKEEDIELYVESNCQEEEQRIGAIVGFDRDGEVLSVNAQTLAAYRDYLEKHLTSPCYVTGIQDLGCFGWEQYYTLGSGSKKEYEQRRKSKPSYRDTYELLGFEDEIQDEFYGLLVHVRRTSDHKHFCLTLSDLKATDENWKQEQILDDYSVWFVNWR